jgi:addiction module RelE/StbE family toxin
VATVRWTERAKGDLQEVYNFIARDSPRAADALVERIARAADRLAAFPESGRTMPEFPTLPYREVIVGNYRVLYRIERESVWIAAVVHGRRLHRVVE